MREATYRIMDEPRPGTLQRFVVNPFWPLLAMMMSGAWLAGPWFIFNAFAMGSATRKSETWLVIGSVFASLALIFALGVLMRAGYFPETARPYGQIALTVLKLAFAYVVFMRQERSLALYQYFGGAVRNGALIVVAGVMGRGALTNAPSWFQVLFMS